MNRPEFMRSLVASYNIDDKNWGINAQAKIEKYFAELPPSKSPKDPQRLGPKAVFLSNLKKAILEAKVERFVEDGQPEFNAMTTPQQNNFKIRSLKSGTEKWVYDLDIVPQNLEDLTMVRTQFNELRAIRGRVDAEKLKDPPTIIDGDKLISTVLPKLATVPTSRNDVLKNIVPALLLATGRRTIEILKTAKFSLTPQMRSDGYECLFEGQAKQGLNPTEEFAIPLLAPYWLVKQALDYVRANVDGSLSEATLNSNYASMISRVTYKLANLNPHQLRAIYAMMCFQLEPTKSSMMGFIASILGHINPTNAMYYQRVSIHNFTGPYVPTGVAVVAGTPTTPWVFYSEPERKRIESIKNMMLQKAKITATAVRLFAGGTLHLIQRVIANNQSIIDAYNAAL